MPQIFHFKIVKIYLEQPGYFMISFLILKKKKKKKKHEHVSSLIFNSCIIYFPSSICLKSKLRESSLDIKLNFNCEPILPYVSIFFFLIIMTSELL